MGDKARDCIREIDKIAKREKRKGEGVVATKGRQNKDKFARREARAKAAQAERGFQQIESEYVERCELTQGVVKYQSPGSSEMSRETSARRQAMERELKSYHARTEMIGGDDFAVRKAEAECSHCSGVVDYCESNKEAFPWGFTVFASTFHDNSVEAKPRKRKLHNDDESEKQHNENVATHCICSNNDCTHARCANRLEHWHRKKGCLVNCYVQSTGLHPCKSCGEKGQQEKGVGLFAGTRLPSECYVGQCTGEQLDDSQFRSRFGDTSCHCAKKCVLSSGGTIIDAASHGNPTRLINHAAEDRANVRMEMWTLRAGEGAGDRDRHFFFIFTKENGIGEGDELLLCCNKTLNAIGRRGW